jgi:hypothetical protein
MTFRRKGIRGIELETPGLTPTTENSPVTVFQSNATTANYLVDEGYNNGALDCLNPTSPGRTGQYEAGSGIVEKDVLPTNQLTTIAPGEPDPNSQIYTSGTNTPPPRTTNQDSGIGLTGWLLGGSLAAYLLIKLAAGSSPESSGLSGVSARKRTKRKVLKVTV